MPLFPDKKFTIASAYSPDELRKRLQERISFSKSVFDSYFQKGDKAYWGYIQGDEFFIWRNLFLLSYPDEYLNLRERRSIFMAQGKIKPGQIEFSLSGRIHPIFFGAGFVFILFVEICHLSIERQEIAFPEIVLTAAIFFVVAVFISLTFLRFYQYDIDLKRADFFLRQIAGADSGHAAQWNLTGTLKPDEYLKSPLRRSIPGSDTILTEYSQEEIRRRLKEAITVGREKASASEAMETSTAYEGYVEGAAFEIWRKGLPKNNFFRIKGTFAPQQIEFDLQEANRWPMVLRVSSGVLLIAAVIMALWADQSVNYFILMAISFLLWVYLSLRRAVVYKEEKDKAGLFLRSILAST